MTTVSAPTASGLRPSPSQIITLATAGAWLVTVVWAIRMDMGLWGMPGTMGMALWSFLVMWTAMMAAMMLGSMGPLATLYGRTITARRGPRLTAFAAGYLLAWSSTGVIAYLLADRFGAAAADHADLARGVAVGAFVAAGLYQLTPLKHRCLAQCRTPLGHLMHYLGYRGPTRDLRAGFHHGLFCLGCCWALMVLMVAFGVMNVAAMVGLALVIAIEKHWRHGVGFARAVGAVSLAWALLIVFEPAAAPGLDPGATMTMDMADTMPPETTSPVVTARG